MPAILTRSEFASDSGHARRRRQGRRPRRRASDPFLLCKASMLQDLDATLAALLGSELSLPNVSVSFAPPDHEFPPSRVTLPAMAFFLYDVRENFELRSAQGRLTGQARASPVPRRRSGWTAPT
jgi:hypothetical protein